MFFGLQVGLYVNVELAKAGFRVQGLGKFTTLNPQP